MSHFAVNKDYIYMEGRGMPKSNAASYNQADAFYNILSKKVLNTLFFVLMLVAFNVIYLFLLDKSFCTTGWISK